jgi:site-specific DNA-methyltransferase (adenine-specific)
MIELLNEDNMQLMARYPDKYFDLAIVDPEYGIGASEMTMGKGKNKQWSKGKGWDNKTPSNEYFKELGRVSKSQIVWGGNYFELPKTGGWIFWDKDRRKEVSFSDGELAWTNFLKTLKKITVRYDGFIGSDGIKIHPTQKPIKLYKECLRLYAKQGDKILDTHLGSGSIAIACHDMGFDLVACEIDKDYYEAAVKRFNEQTKQQKLFAA